MLACGVEEDGNETEKRSGEEGGEWDVAGADIAVPKVARSNQLQTSADGTVPRFPIVSSSRLSGRRNSGGRSTKTYELKRESDRRALHSAMRPQNSLEDAGPPSPVVYSFLGGETGVKAARKGGKKESTNLVLPCEVGEVGSDADEELGEGSGGNGEEVTLAETQAPE